jgi:hypothetical protein
MKFFKKINFINLFDKTYKSLSLLFYLCLILLIYLIKIKAKLFEP